jgi:flavin-dependent dehydrogenase
MAVDHYEVAVVGGGTAGLHAATLFARAGRKVVLVDRRARTKAGPTWVNGVVPWQFERAGLPDPQHGFGIEHDRSSFHLVSPGRDQVATVEDNPVVHLDMRVLTAYLRDQAAAAGVSFRWETAMSAGRYEQTNGGARLAQIDSADGFLSITAELFVDASGMPAVLRSQHPEAAHLWPRPNSTSVCRALDYTYEVLHPEGADAFCVLWGAEPGSALCFSSPSNGYSVSVLTVAKDRTHVNVLVGTLEADSPHSAKDLLWNVVADHPWIGRPIFGGGGQIPLAPPFDALGAAGLALIGDAANQVMAAHGSGIGLGLIAARILADSADASDLGSAATIDRYERAFHREFGALLHGYDRFRRFSSSVGPSGVQQLFDSGVFDGDLAEPGLHQHLGSIPPNELPRRLLALGRRPKLAWELAPVLLGMQLVRPLFATRPSRQSAAYPVWKRAERRLTRRWEVGV